MMGSLMLFHYGNCKQKIKELEGQITSLLTQIHEGKAVYDYQVGILEKDVEQLQRDICSRTCAFETLTKENQNLNQIISRKDDTIKQLREEVARALNQPDEEEELEWEGKKKSKRKK